MDVVRTEDPRKRLTLFADRASRLSSRVSTNVRTESRLISSRLGSGTKVGPPVEINKDDVW